MDKYNLIETIINCTDLSHSTKQLYLKKLDIICYDIYSPTISLEYLICNPDEFSLKLNQYIYEKSYGDHTKESFVSPIITIFLHNSQLKNECHELYSKWVLLLKTIKEPLEHKYKTNEPTEKQKDAYIDYKDLVKIRDTQSMGSLQRLLLSMYIDIPPARSDYSYVKILYSEPTAEILGSNYLVISKNHNYLCLEKYKTSKTYGTIKIDIPINLIQEIKYSLELIPRTYLFISTKTNNPYPNENAFNSWANNALKRMTKNNNINLTTLRHIYISRRDLEVEKMSGLQQDEIAKQMGHSIEQQRKYLWHTWLNKQESNIIDII